MHTMVNPDDGALCAQTDPEIFFPEKGGSTKAPKALCARCDLRVPCLEEALQRREAYGVWGGLTAIEREGILRSRGEQGFS